MFELSPQDWTAVQLSLRVAAVSTLVALPLGITIATLLARKSFWGKSIIDAAVHLPLVLPPVVTGYLLLISFGRKAPIGAFLADHFGIVFSFRWTGAALACGVMAFPLMVRAIRLSVESIDMRLEDAAATLGANRMWTFVTVTLPLALPGIITLTNGIPYFNVNAGTDSTVDYYRYVVSRSAVRAQFEINAPDGDMASMAEPWPGLQ